MAGWGVHEAELRVEGFGAVRDGADWILSWRTPVGATTAVRYADTVRVVSEAWRTEHEARVSPDWGERLVVRGVSRDRDGTAYHTPAVALSLDGDVRITD